MKQNLLHMCIGVSLIAGLSACGSASVDEAPDVGAALPAPSKDTVDVSVATVEVTAPVAPVALATDTDTLIVPEEFSFDSARTIDVEFDLEQARGQDASVSICTKYGSDGDAFDVDYTSCAVRGPMVDGVFSHSMEITNEFDSVIAVVWFQDSAMEPLHRVFSINEPVAMTNTRGIKSVSSQRRVIVWK